MDLVTIATFPTSEEAHLAKNRLELKGIRAALNNEYTRAVSFGISTPVSLQVASDEAERASGILLSIRSESAEVSNG
jgi:hypothetical protein